MQKNKNDYYVLARKYRPKLFSELIGQEVLVKTITNAIKLKRVPHAYLLTGVRGIGKTTTARLISRALNCENLEKNNYEPCGTCTLCQSIVNEKNMDVIEMDAASRTGVDDVREIIESVKYKPNSSKYKIYIIDEVHMLSKNAFNALLKTLEEPPPQVKFIFATTEVHKIPITILSRCQRFDLYRVDEKTLTKYLMDISKKEGIEISQDAVALVVRSADGSVRDGLSLLDQAIVNIQEGHKIISEDIIKMLGLAERTKIYDLLDLIFKGDAVGSLNLYKELYTQGVDVLMIFEEMLKIVHFLTEAKILPEIIKNPYIPELERTKGKEMSERISIPVLGRFWQVLFQGYQELRQSIHAFQVSEMIIIRLLFLSDLPSPQDLIRKIKNYENKSLISKNNEIENDYENNKTINQIQTPNIDINQKNKLIKNTNHESIKITSFRELVELFHKYKEPIIYSRLYNETKLINFKEGKLEINCNSIKDKNFIKTITKLISKWTGRIWTVLSSDNSTGKTLAEEDIIIKEMKLEEVKKDNDIKRILDIFPGSTIHSIDPISKDDNLEKENENNVGNIKEEVK